MNNSKRHNRVAWGTPARHRLYAGIFTALLAIGGTAPVYAQSSDTPQEYSIQAGSLGDALNQLATQSRLQIIYAPDLVKGKTAVAVTGQHTWHEALQHLLSGSGLTWGLVNDTTVVIKKADKQSNPATPSQARKPAATKEDESVTELEKIVVTGTNIRGVGDTAAPTITFSREEIERTGYVTVHELFESLPQNFDDMSPDGRLALEGGSRLSIANADHASSINLRGLGAQSTLTLFNGKRLAGSVGGRAVDVSGVPLSLLDRVEVVTGGRSSIYGSDAVAGVVNFVTRRYFEGSESRASYGGSENGGERLQFSQAFGTNSDHGGLIASYDFVQEWPLNLVDTGLVEVPNSADGRITYVQNNQPDSQRHTGFLSGQYAINDSVELNMSALSSSKKFEGLGRVLYPGAVNESVTSTQNSSTQHFASVGAQVNLGASWLLDISGSGSSVDINEQVETFLDLGFFSGSFPSARRDRAVLTGISVVADGKLPSIGKITPQVAVGVETREERFKRVANDLVSDEDRRSVRSIFAEMLIPIVEDGRRVGIDRLDLSISGRYDRYSDFGSAFNPQVGVILNPGGGLTIRGAYSTAFRAPALIELGSSARVVVANRTDPMRNGEDAAVLEWTGENPDLGPEDAKTWSIGIDYVPEAASWLKASASYFDVEYENRIDVPVSGSDVFLILENEGRYPGLINRNPTEEEIEQIVATDSDGLIQNSTGRPWNPDTQSILDAFPDLVLFDGRTNNIAIERARGVDVNISADLATRIGDLSFGINASYMLQHERSLTTTSPVSGMLNEVGKPVDFRYRGNAGWQKDAYSAFLYVNYVDDYADPFSAPASKVASWTTVDLSLRLDGSKIPSASWAEGLSAALSIHNLLDKEPPEFQNSLIGLRYDPTNASPIGRYVSLSLAKRW